MASKSVQMQRQLREYRRETGEAEVDMKKVAAWAVDRGWPLSRPTDPLEVLAKEFARAAREETRQDEITGDPYRVNHAIPGPDGQLRLWIDIDHAPRRPMHKSLMNRREQMVGDGLQLTRDAEHWNRINPTEEPIVVPMDFTDDIEWRRNSPPEEANG